MLLHPQHEGFNFQLTSKITYTQKFLKNRPLAIIYQYTPYSVNITTKISLI